MDRPLVYLETTIASAFFERRSDRGSVERRHWTRRWWAESSPQVKPVVSAAVWAEHLRGPIDRQREWHRLILGVDLLGWNPDVQRIADHYGKSKVMPGSVSGDALHLAFASYYGCDVLLTWDLRHLANPAKFDHIRHVNRSLGVSMPQIVTPRQFLGEDRG